jgi:O-antigen ligase
MITTKMWSRVTAKDISWRIFFTSPYSYISLLALIVVLLMGGVVIERLSEGSLGNLGIYILAGIIGTFLTAIIIIMQQYELASVFILAVSLYVDFYAGLYIVAQVMALALLVILFLGRTHRYPWVEPRAIWLWMLFLTLTIVPSINGALNVGDALLYYPNVILGAFIMFWLGQLIGRDILSMRRFFVILSVFAMLIAIHTIMQAVIGSTFLQLHHAVNYLANASYYQLGTNVGVYRDGSFFVDPNWNGTFLTVTLFIPLGLFFESSLLLKRIFYLAEAFVILIALFFTYSAGASVAALVGVLVFTIFLGRMRYRLQFVLVIIIAAVVMLVYFPSQVNLLLQHGSDPSELAIRGGAWGTALGVIQANPLTGIGLGHQAYQERSEPYRLAANALSLDHPHNSYLEWGAMAGLPVLLVFLALVLFALYRALHNWIDADAKTRSLLGAGIASIIVLSVNSWSIDGWTLPPIAAVGWMILGVISSPLLAKSQIVKWRKKGKSSILVT